MIHMVTRYIADLHLQHANCPAFYDNFVDQYNEKYQLTLPKLGYKDGDRWTAFLIQQWNSVVEKDDVTYIIGDVGYGDKNPVIIDAIKQLNGTLILIEGNHDHRMMKDLSFRKCFAEIHPKLATVYQETRGFAEMPDHNVISIIMTHHPIMCHQNHMRDAIQLYGHIHNHFLYEEAFQDMCVTSFKAGMPHRAINVGCECFWMDFKPQTLEYIVRHRDYWGKHAGARESAICPSKELKDRVQRAM